MITPIYLSKGYLVLNPMWVHVNCVVGQDFAIAALTNRH